MAIKKSELYSSLWSSCDELCGGMDASQRKDYVLVMLYQRPDQQEGHRLAQEGGRPTRLVRTSLRRERVFAHRLDQWHWPAD